MKRITIKRLRPNRAVSLHVPAEATLMVARGKAWLTSDADSADRFLCHGRRYTAVKAEHLVLQAIDKTVVYAIRYPEPRNFRVGLTAFWKGQIAAPAAPRSAFGGG
ncbi:MAG TPA: DUF2917 domain-containing protein [Burkholderiales bacterium]|nr:DUF2917 domain-containing protein [Burkholderiales bacterium]